MFGLVTKRKYGELRKMFVDKAWELDNLHNANCEKDKRITELQSLVCSNQGKHGNEVRAHNETRERLAETKAELARVQGQFDTLEGIYADIVSTLERRFDALETSIEGAARNGIYEHGKILDLLSRSTDIKHMEALDNRVNQLSHTVVTLQDKAMNADAEIADLKRALAVANDRADALTGGLAAEKHKYQDMARTVTQQAAAIQAAAEGVA